MLEEIEGGVVFDDGTLSKTVTGADFSDLGKLTLNFVPEPGTLLLLGSGVAGLAALGRRRMRRD